MAKIKPQALLQQSKKKKGPSRIGVATIAMYGLTVVVMAIFIFASYRYWNRRSRSQTEDMLSGVQHDSSHVDLQKADLPKYAVINTSKGSITVELYKEGSPEVVNEFVESCQKGRFKGMLFDRVIKNFVIQGGGDINGHESTEDWTVRGKHYNQLDTSLKHEAFLLGTSKTKKNGGVFDLFITTAPIPHLNENINVFGRVIKGEDVVQEIEEADTDEHYRPKTHRDHGSDVKTKALMLFFSVLASRFLEWNHLYIYGRVILFLCHYCRWTLLMQEGFFYLILCFLLLFTCRVRTAIRARITWARR